MDNTVQNIAKEARDWFELIEVEDRKFWARKKDAPDWIEDLTFSAHDNGEWFPDDHRYELIVSALEWIADEADPLDTSSDFADAQVDVYTHGRLAWLGQYEEAGEVYGATLLSLESILESRS